MSRGRADWTAASLIKGQDPDGNLVTVAVDAVGNIVGVFTGEYGGSPQILATDADGRILARLMGKYGTTMIDIACDDGGKMAVADITQEDVIKDTVEEQEWTTPIISLLANMCRIRYAIISMSGEAWGTFSHSIAQTWTQITTAISTHAALTATHGVAGTIAGLADITTHTAIKDAHFSNVITITFIIDGGGAAITTGQKGHLEIPFACTLTGWTLAADVAGAIVIDVWKDTYANFPPTNTDAMPGGGKEPTIAATNQKAQDTDISDWATVAITAGDILAFNVDSCTTITRVTLSLKATKT